jgi:SAM-dependent methyltransferase
MSFDDAFRSYEKSPWLLTRFGSLLDPDLPAEVEPFSFVLLEALRELAAALAVGPGDALVDLACGRAGPGMWLARETGATLTGVDGSPVAVAQAGARSGRFGLEGRARFVVGDLAGTGLADAGADGVVCVDAFQFAPDPVAAAVEVLRILRPGGRFALTNWEPLRPDDPDVPERLRHADFAKTLAAAGFVGTSVRVRPAWEEHRRRVYEAALAAGDPVEDSGLALIQQEARVALPEMHRVRRVLVVARRPGP